MKKLLFLLALAIPLCLFAQDASYTMYQTVYLEPDLEHLKDLEANMKAHNEKFHSEAPYGAIVWQVSSGPNSGKLVWMMGPCTFTDLDDRPAGDDHSSDWRDNVMSLMEDIGPIEYWRRNDDLSIVVDGPPKPIVRVRFSNVIRGQSHRVNGMFGKIRDAIKEMEGENTWGVYLNEFQQGYETGRHFATSTGMDSWSELDEGSGTEFSEAYIKAHGAGAWSTFNQELREVFSNTWDEYWVIRPDLSGVSLED